MDKRDLTRDMKSFYGSSIITRKKFAEYMGVKDPKNVDKYLFGLERVDEKYYFITDVAAVLKERCTIS